MSASAATPEATVAPDPFAGVTDGSTLSVTREEFDGFLAEYLAGVDGSIEAYRIGAAKNKVSAAALVALSLTIEYKGHPDWSLKSGLYRDVILKGESEKYANNAEKSKVQAAIRQEKSRNFLEPGITAFVIRTGDHGVKNGDLKWTPATPAAPSVIAEFDESDAKQMALRAQIAAEYLAADLTLPVKFGGVKPGTGGGPGNVTEENAPAASARGIAAQEKMTADAAASDLLRGTVALCKRVRGTDTVTDREKVEKSCHRIHAVAGLTAKSLAGKITPAEIEALDKLLAVIDAEFAPSK